MVPLEIPRGFIRDYIRVSKIVAIYIANPPIGKPCEIGVTTDLSKVRASLQRNWHFAVEIVAAYWLKDRRAALAIVDAVAHREAQGKGWRVKLNGEEARAVIEAIAKDQDVILTEHGAMMARVGRATKQIADALVQAQREGRLKWFNRAYKRYRLAKLEPRYSYAKAWLLMRRIVTRRVIAGAPDPFAPDMLRELFPNLHLVDGPYPSPIRSVIDKSK